MIRGVIGGVRVEAVAIGVTGKGGGGSAGGGGMKIGGGAIRTAKVMKFYQLMYWVSQEQLEADKNSSEIRSLNSKIEHPSTVDKPLQQLTYRNV